MAQAREIKKRIRSVESTRKITRTMELVATSKMKKAQERVYASRPYASKLREILETVSRAAAGEVDHPLLRVPESPKKIAVFLITSNRGLCGAYNSNVIRMTLAFLAQQREEGRETVLYVSGKKAINVLQWRGIKVAKKYTAPSDHPRYEHVEEIGGEFLRDFASGQIDRVVLVYTRFASAGRLIPTLETLFPLTTEDLEKPVSGPSKPAGSEKRADAGKADSGKAGAEKPHGSRHHAFLFEPSAEAIMASMLPLMVKMRLFEVLLNAQASEHSARMVAMKTATDNAGDLIRNLKRVYNRQRQAHITQELAEILGGVEALKG